VAELQRQPGGGQRQEGHDDDDVHGDVALLEAAHVLATGAVVADELAALQADDAALQPKQRVDAEEAEHADDQRVHRHRDPGTRSGLSLGSLGSMCGLKAGERHA
jgi:hypothetical protein